MTGEEMVQCDVPDTLTMFSYLTQIYEAFRGEIPYIKHPKLVSNFKDRSWLLSSNAFSHTPYNTVLYCVYL